MSNYLEQLIFWAGIFQIVLALVSPIIPKLLNWKQELGKVSPLIRQMFWTYSGYILVTNFSFGLVSVISPQSLLEGQFLSKVVTLFIAVYWISRILIQFFYFDRSAAPKGGIYQWGEVGLVGLFVFLSFVYSLALYSNF